MLNEYEIGTQYLSHESSAADSAISLSHEEEENEIVIDPEQADSAACEEVEQIIDFDPHAPFEPDEPDEIDYLDNSNQSTREEVVEEADIQSNVSLSIKREKCIASDEAADCEQDSGLERSNNTHSQEDSSLFHPKGDFHELHFHHNDETGEKESVFIPSQSSTPAKKRSAEPLTQLQAEKKRKFTL